MKTQQKQKTVRSPVEMGHTGKAKAWKVKWVLRKFLSEVCWASVGKIKQVLSGGGIKTYNRVNYFVEHIKLVLGKINIE